MATVQKLVTEDSFDARGVFVPKGHIAVYDDARLNGEEKHIKEVGDFTPAVVEISAIAPTGPNPQMPQQLPPDAVQGPGASYVTPGKVLVGEVTNPVEQRIEQPGLRDAENEANVDQTLNDIMGGAPSVSVDGTVKDVTADLGTKTDDELTALRDAENARDKPRAGVLTAVDAELAARQAAQAPAA